MSETLRIALDRSVRERDIDGRLHVAIANISRATVNPYYGREIPNASAMGLKADQVYQVFRDPEALRLGAASFNNLQLMDEHIIVSATDPQKDRVVGSTGTDAAFDGEFLTNSLVIWDADAIARIESGAQKELSCAYRWTPINRPGAYKGQKYDLVMSALVGNHVALVPAGRAGPDVVVGDSLENAPMILSRAAVMLKGALKVAAQPILATDAAIDFNALVAGVTAKNYAADTVFSRFTAASKGKLAADASLEPIRMALDAMKEDCEGMDAEEDQDEAAKKADDAKKAKDAKAAKAAKDKKARDAKTAKDKAAKDEEEGEEEEEERAEDEDMPEGMDKKAMDAAIRTAVEAAETRTVARMNSIAEARRQVAPFVGEIVVAMDSAEDVYKFALDKSGVSTKDVPPAAFKAMVGMLPDPAAPVARIALDAQHRTSRNEAVAMFPALARIAQ